MGISDHHDSRRETIEQYKARKGSISVLPPYHENYYELPAQPEGEPMNPVGEGCYRKPNKGGMLMLTIHQRSKDIIMAYGGTPKESNAIMAHIATTGTWGFLDEHKTIHLYYRIRAREADLFDVAAHELAHKRGAEIIASKDDEALADVIDSIYAQACKMLEQVGEV